MKHIILKSLTLINWRGERNRTTEFNPHSTTIAGGNGLGKSRHFDAFIWLLFGKDTQDRKDFNVKTIVDGEPLRKTDSEVSGVLNVDGETITLRRVLVESWVKQRGQVEPVFKGNKTECYWNDTPVNVTEYQKRVEALIDDTVFKMITNPEYFASMPWKQQREQLEVIAGTVSDEEIASKSPEFAAFLENIKGKGVEDFKREITARKKRLKADLSEVQPRIDQTRKLMPEQADFVALDAEAAELEAQIESVDKAITDSTERENQRNSAVQQLQREINDLKRERQQVLFNAEAKAQEEQHKANAERRAIEVQITETKQKLSESIKAANNATAKIEHLRHTVQELERQCTELRSQWHDKNSEKFQGSDTCYCCGQELPETMKAQARELFDKMKKEQLSQITTKGKALAEEQATHEETIRTLQYGYDYSISEQDAQNKALQALEQQLAQLPEAKAAKVIAENIPEYVELTSHIAQLEERQAEQRATVNTDSNEAYHARKKELTSQRDAIRTKLSDRERIAAFELQVEELENQGRVIAQQIADIEKEEYTAYQFAKYKAEACEKRINNLFSLVTFKLFEYTIEDTNKERPIETCVPLVNGVPINVANTASRVNAGIDIINTLCKFHGVTAPVFVDNRESVNELIDTESQIINLVVTEDKELIIK